MQIENINSSFHYYYNFHFLLFLFQAASSLIGIFKLITSATLSTQSLLKINVAHRERENERESIKLKSTNKCKYI